MSLKIALGGDHAGYDLKVKILEFLEEEGYVVEDSSSGPRIKKV